MKKLITIIFLAAVCGSASAQYCYWATRSGGIYAEDGYGMTTDNSGNVIVTGSFSSSSVIFGSYTLNNASLNSPDYYIAKYNSSGTVLWAQRAGRSIDDVGKCVVTDATGNIYVAGYFGTDTIFFGSLYAVNSAYGNMDMFLVKYDPNGNPLWVRKTSGGSDEIPYAITIDGGGNVVVTGKHYGSSMSSGATTITNLGFGTNVFVVSWTANGTLKWLQGAGKANDDAAYGISDDNGSGIYLTGYFRSDTLRFGTQWAANSTPGNEEMFVAKLDTAGNAVYVKSIGGDDADMGYDIVADAFGNCYMTGKWRSSSITVGTNIYSSPSNYDLLFVKFDPAGNVLWSHAPAGSAQDDARSIDIDASGDVYATGDFNGTLNFSTSALPQIGIGADIYVVKYNSAGVEQWATSVSNGGSSTYSISVTGINDMYLCGSFGGSALNFGTTTLASAGAADFFLAHMYSFSTSVNTVNFVSCNGGMDGSVSAIVSGGFAPYNYVWSNSQNNDTAINLGVGTYTITVYDANGCSTSSNISLSEPSALTLTVTSQDIDCSQGQTGSASASVSGGTTPYSYAWSNGDTVATITNAPADSLFLIITDANGCTSNGLAIVHLVPAPMVPVCMVTVDSASQYNIIMWDKTPFTMVDSFIIYREISTNDYRRIGVRPYADSSYFIDTVRTLYSPNTGDPNNGTYRYKIQAVDTCGVYGPLSPYHNTIYIINTNGTFSWPQLYTIESGPNPVTNYVLWRDNLSNGNWVPVASVAGTQQVVSDPGYTTYQATGTWRVQTLWSISCTPTARYADPSLQSNWNSSFSNMQGQAIITHANNQAASLNVNIFPTITDGIFTVQTDNYTDATVEVYSSVGELVYSSSLSAPSTQLDLSGNAAGIYFVMVKNREGIVTQQVIRQ